MEQKGLKKTKKKWKKMLTGGGGFGNITEHGAGERWARSLKTEQEQTWKKKETSISVKEKTMSEDIWKS